MAILAQTLVDDTRVISGLRANPLFSDTQICELLNDAYDELADKFVAAVQHWFRATVSFTLTGNTPGTNTFDLTTIPDFQMDQGLNWLPNGPTGPSFPVLRLGSFAERGTAGGGIAGIGGLTSARRYFTNGDLLFVDPYVTSAGQYTLVYTPQRVPLALTAGAGVTTTLPALLTPWALYLKVHAAIAIQTSRKQPTNELQVKLAAQAARITSMSKMRSEGVTQAPITGRTRGWRRGGWGYYG